jgi:hypothetical protein
MITGKPPYVAEAEEKNSDVLVVFSFKLDTLALLPPPQHCCRSLTNMRVRARAIPTSNLRSTT